jgi:hypothetical protein
VYQRKGAFVLALNRSLFYKLFDGISLGQFGGYHVGGVVRTSLVECVVHVLCHEIVHLVILVCNHKDKSKPHPTVFKDMSLAYFGHTVEKHGLVPGLVHEADFVSTRRLARPGVRALVFGRGGWTLVTIVYIGRLYVQVRDQQGKIARVHIGLIKLSE